MNFSFKINKKSKESRARSGIIETPHGTIETPQFMPVGTVGAVKSISPKELSDFGAQIVLANTYHLYLRPSDVLVKKLGGLHKFMNWPKPILTDSGGYQVFSLSESGLKRAGDLKIKPAKITDKGVHFYSHLDGTKHFIGPRESIAIQENLGADIIMAFDQCPSTDSSKQEVSRAVQRTKEWLDICFKVKKREDQLLVPICQGGMFEDLREESIGDVLNYSSPVYAIGGVSVGESKAKIYSVIDFCTKKFPESSARYAMGIGYPEDIVEIIKSGVDIFDCVLPTRLARHGNVWVKVKKGKGISLGNLPYDYQQIDLRKSVFAELDEPLSKECVCEGCKGFSCAYLHHLVKEKEILGIRLLTAHNLQFILNMVKDIRDNIEKF